MKVVNEIIQLISDDPFFYAFVAVSALLAIFITRRFVRTKGSLPPGPIGVPLLGYVPFLGEFPERTFSKLGEKYGNVFSLYFGPKLTVVLNDWDAVKSAYIDQADTFAGRSDAFIFRWLTGGEYGLISTEGNFFKEQKRFMLSSLREMGMGKSKFDLLMQEEAEELCENLLEPKVGFAPGGIFLNSMSNLILAISIGKRAKKGDKKIQLLADLARESADALGQAGVLQVYPILRFFPPNSHKWEILVKSRATQQEIFKQYVDEAIKLYDPETDAPGCYVDYHMKKKATLKENELVKNYSYTQLRRIVEGLFGAGIDTGRTSLTWAVRFFIEYPEIQEKVYDEIVQNVGIDHTITYEERGKLPFLEAVMMETLRCGNVVPLSVLRRNVRDTYLNGYFIPKGTYVIPNMWNVHYSEEHFPEPRKFKPERFIDAETNKVIRPEMYMPFCVGKRSCPGEGIAKMEFFVFLANIVRRIRFKKVPDEVYAPLGDVRSGITIEPAPFNVITEARV